MVSNIVDLPDATLLDGATVVEKGSKFILLADSMAGVVWRLNLETLEYGAVLNDTATQSATPVAAGGFSVNGVHTRGGFLYFTELGFFRVPIHHDGTQTGIVEVSANFTRGDEFTFGEAGNVYIARGAVDLISEVTPAGKVVSLDYENADALVLVEGNTAVKFGRTKCDRKTLYITTNGGYSGLVNGTAIQGGRVLAIDLEERS